MYCFSQLCGLSGLSGLSQPFLPGITDVAALSWQTCSGLGSAGAVDWRAPLPRGALAFLTCLRTREAAWQECGRGSGMTSESLDSDAMASRQLHSTGRRKSWGQPRSKRSEQAPADARSSNSHGKKQARRAVLQPSSEMICHI